MKKLWQSDTIRSVGRWYVVGALFTALTVPVLYLFREVVGLSLMVASLITWELGNVLRFVVNDRWVFGQRRPTWERFWKYHAAVAVTFVIWWVGTNVLPRWGIHYLLASVVATAGSVMWSMGTHYLWVWRRPGQVAS